MKRSTIFFMSVIMPMLLSAQTYSTGITPYTFVQIDSYFARSEWNKGEALLSKIGYTKVSEDKEQIGWSAVYCRGCNIKESNGRITSVTPTRRDGYASYITLIVGTGFDTNLSVTFLSTTGSNYFVNLLKQTNYKLKGSAWIQSSTDNCIVQEGKDFFIPGVEGADIYM